MLLVAVVRPILCLPVIVMVGRSRLGLLHIEIYRNNFCSDVYIMSRVGCLALSFIIVQISLHLTHADCRWSEEYLDEGSLEEATKRYITIYN